MYPSEIKIPQHIAALLMAMHLQQHRHNTEGKRTRQTLDQVVSPAVSHQHMLDYLAA